MFTGIVREVGRISSFIVHRSSFINGGADRLVIEAKEVSKGIEPGDSVAVNGVCLTLVEKSGIKLSFDVMEETLNRTNIGAVRPGSRVNLESALRAGDAIGGHFVLGHVDCVCSVKRAGMSGREHSIEIDVPEEYSGLLIEKGSIAIDGVSLTIGRVDRGACAVYVIPHTLGSTTLGSVRPGEKVNVEFDVLGKYILRNTMDRSPLRGSGGALHRMVRGSGQAPGAIRTTNITDSFLKEHGFPA